MPETRSVRFGVSAALVMLLAQYPTSRALGQEGRDSLLMAVGAYVRASAPNDTIRVSRSRFCNVSAAICDDPPAQLAANELRALMSGASADTIAPKVLMPSSRGVLHILLGKVRVGTDSATVGVWKGNNVEITVHQLQLVRRTGVWKVVADRVVGGT